MRSTIAVSRGSISGSSPCSRPLTRCSTYWSMQRAAQHSRAVRCLSALPPASDRVSSMGGGERTEDRLHILGLLVDIEQLAGPQGVAERFVQLAEVVKHLRRQDIVISGC